MNRIMCCDWLPLQARWSDLARSGYGFCPASTQIMLWCFILYNKSFIDQACSVKMAGYWPCSFFWCFILYNKSFIDQACSVKMAGCWPRSFFFVFYSI